jgi:hypothetical protein
MKLQESITFQKLFNYIVSHPVEDRLNDMYHILMSECILENFGENKAKGFVAKWGWHANKECRINAALDEMLSGY